MAFLSKLFDREETPQRNYLTFRPTYVDCSFSYTKPGTGPDLEISLDNGASWHTLPASTNSVTYEVLVRYNDTIMWRGNITPNVTSNFEVDTTPLYTSNPSDISSGAFLLARRDMYDRFGYVSNDSNVVNSGSVHFTASSKFEAEGNPASILVGDDVDEITDLSNYNGVDYKGAFIGMFRKQSKLVSVENMFLSFDTLSDDCFAFMFSGCTNLVNAPKLNSMNLSKWCYAYMFSWNENLIGVETLPSLTLYERSYFAMFGNCHNLQIAPQIAATTVGKECCALMFLETWDTTTFGYGINDRLPATNLAYGCYAFMFAWSSIKHYPMLPARTLVEKCYYGFGYQRQGIRQFSPATFGVMAVDRSATDCLNLWLGHVSSAFTQNISFFYNSDLGQPWPTGGNNVQNGTVPSVWSQTAATDDPPM